MSKIDQYLEAATRENTRQSYRSAVEHYEVAWGGFLPATPDNIAKYLADHAETLAYSTLKQRLAALAQWHKTQGFPDPTKAPMVKKVLKRIAELHPQQTKQAKPLQLDTLDTITFWHDTQIRIAKQHNEHSQLTTLLRNKALMLVGFWRAFRNDEPCRMRIENILLHPSEGMTIYLPRSKTDRINQGVSYKVPMLSRLCPVSAYQDWTAHIGETEGAVFRKVNRWGKLSADALHPRSIIPLLRTVFSMAGINDAQYYSSHSLRRGFASWAGDNQWDLKSLMAYVGWKNMHSALGYLEGKAPFAQRHIESALQRQPSLTNALTLSQGSTLLKVHLSIERFHPRVKTKPQVHQLIEKFCLSPHNMKTLNENRSQYHIEIYHTTDDELNDIVDDLMQQMHSLANERQCMLEVSIENPAISKWWH